MPDPIEQDKPLPENVHQVESTVVEKGKIKANWNPFNSNRTPTILARVTKALRYFCVGIITVTSTSNMFDASQSTRIAFWISCTILVLGAVDIVVGIEPESK